MRSRENRNQYWQEHLKAYYTFGLSQKDVPPGRYRLLVIQPVEAPNRRTKQNQPDRNQVASADTTVPSSYDTQVQGRADNNIATISIRKNTPGNTSSTWRNAMRIDWNTVRIFIKPGITDMRKQINGLAVITAEEMHQDPLSGHLYMFCSRRLLKLLYWDRNGFCMWLVIPLRFIARPGNPGKRSEKLSKEEMDQLFLFNEAEDGVDEKSLEAKGQDKITVPSYTRKKHGRKRLSEDIPRKEVIHDLDDDEKQCPCCGKDLPHIGEEVTEELDIIPQQIIVNKHIKKKYGPCNCDDFLAEEIPEIKTAKVPERFIPGSIATPGLISYSIVSKFCDALPFYRQAKIYSRFGVDISRATLCNWSLLAAEKCIELLKVLEETILSGPVVRMDEASLQVLHEEGRKPESKSYVPSFVPVI
jgi:transposase